jgi:hypothetical protein
LVHVKPLTTEVKPVTEHWAGRGVALDQFEPRGVWTGNALSFTPKLQHGDRVLPERILSAAAWYRDDPHTVPAPMLVTEIQITDPTAPLHRSHVRAVRQVGESDQIIASRKSCYLPHIARICRRIWNHDIDELASVIGWHTVEPGNYGEHAARRMDLDDGVEKDRVELKLRGKQKFKKFERQRAASERSFIGPVVDFSVLKQLVPNDPRVLLWQHARAERHHIRLGNSKKFAWDCIQSHFNIQDRPVLCDLDRHLHKIAIPLRWSPGPMCNPVRQDTSSAVDRGTRVHRFKRINKVTKANTCPPLNATARLFEFPDGSSKRPKTSPQKNLSRGGKPSECFSNAA